MAAPFDIIRLDPHDDIASVRDRFGFIETHRVLLVWPDEGTIFRRKLDLVLLQREARRRAARMALVTRDLDVIDNARDLNLSTFASVEESQEHRWKRGRSKVFIDRSDRPETEPDPSDLRDAASRLKAPTATQIALRRGLTVISLLLLVGVLLGVAYVFLPHATLTLTPAREHLDVTIRVVADPAVATSDVTAGIIPATMLRVEIEETATVDTTGSQEEGPSTATGTIVFTNQTDQAVTIPAGTTVNTSAGAIVRFRTMEPVNIAGQQGSIAVVAIEALPQFAGPAGNVPPFAINFIDGPLNEILTAENIDPTSGGRVPVNRIVAQADHDRLLATARQAIQLRALDDLAPLLGDRQTIIPETIRIAETRDEWTTFSVEVGTEAESVSLTMRAIVQAVVIDERLVNQAAFAGMTDRIPPGKIIAPDSMTFTQGEIERITDQGQVTFLANVASDVTSAIDAASLKQALTGLSTNEVIAYLYQHLELAPTASPQIDIWPSFFGRMPVISARIDVILREVVP
jgi:hypothetical protein